MLSVSKSETKLIEGFPKNPKTEKEMEEQKKDIEKQALSCEMLGILLEEEGLKMKLSKREHACSIFYNSKHRCWYFFDNATGKDELVFINSIWDSVFDAVVIGHWEIEEI